MSTLSKGKVLEKFSNELEVQWEIGERWWEWGGYNKGTPLYLPE